MIPSQKPMMLDSALAFERLVKNPKAGSKEGGGKTQVTWDNPPELEAYIDKLQAAADKLTSENRRLRKCHHNISDKVKHVAQFMYTVSSGLSRKSEVRGGEKHSVGGIWWDRLKGAFFKWLNCG